jgi:hypothetical protein
MTSNTYLARRDIEYHAEQRGGRQNWACKPKVLYETNVGLFIFSVQLIKKEELVYAAADYHKEIVWPHFWPEEIILFLLVLVYCTVRELARVIGLSILHMPSCCGSLEVAVELDAVGTIDVDALHFAAQTFPIGEAGHHLQRIAKDQAITPVCIALVKFCSPCISRQAIEIGE